MPRNPAKPPYKSKMNKRSGGYGNYRYDTTIPKPVGDKKGKWKVIISNDDKITWEPLE